MAGTIWMGIIRVGDTGVPVKLHSAVSQNHVQFHLFHKTDKVQLHQQMVCAFEKTPVPAEEQVRGYQIGERRYVLIDPEELEQTEPEGNREIDIHEFVKSNEIDPVFRERTYYLEPDRSSQNYRALARAMEELEVDGICTWVMRKRAFLGALHSAGNALRLNVLRYADEILPPQSLNLEAFSLSPKELAVAGELIERLTVHFEPGKYHNEHLKKVMAMIEKKARGEKFTLFKPRPRKPTGSDRLLEALEASLKKAA